jgi:hypothetical protein
MGRPVSSISENRKSEPFELQVARGNIPYHRSLTVFGYNQDLDTAEESVWPDGGKVPHGQSPAQLLVSSTSTDDAGAGIGARTIRIDGVNANYDEIFEIVTLSGQTAVTTTNTFAAVNNVTVLTVGSAGHNVGVINIGTGVVTLGVPAVRWDLIFPTFNQRTTGHFTVPNGFTGYIVEGMFTSGQEVGTTSVVGKLLVTGPDHVARVGAVVAINNGAVEYNFKYPLVIPEKYCVGATAVGSNNNNLVSSMFTILLIKNEQPFSSGNW